MAFMTYPIRVGIFQTWRDNETGTNFFENTGIFFECEIINNNSKKINSK